MRQVVEAVWHKRKIIFMEPISLNDNTLCHLSHYIAEKQPFFSD